MLENWDEKHCLQSSLIWWKDHIRLVSSYFFLLSFYLWWCGATLYLWPEIGDQPSPCHVEPCIEFEFSPISLALLGESYESNEGTSVPCACHFAHLNLHLSWRPCLRDALENIQSMSQMVSTKWMNAQPYCMHVVHKETAHPTTWDAFHNSSRVNVSLCGWQPWFSHQYADQMLYSSSNWCPSFSTNLSKTLQGN